MSNTYKHKLNGKFHNGLIQANEMPMNILFYWNRMNFWTGHFRNIKKQKIENILDKEMQNELNS